MQKGIGKRIRDARKAAGLTQEELAERMGTSSVAVAQWETGRRNPKMGTVSKLAAALGVDVAELVPELKTLLKEKPEPPPMEPIFEDNGFLTARMTAIQKRAYEMRPVPSGRRTCPTLPTAGLPTVAARSWTT